MPELPDHYRTLQVHVDAEADVIRAAYRALARRHHPDGGGQSAEMAQLNEAYAVLIDPRARAAYDAQVRTADPSARTGASGAPASSPARPGWQSAPRASRSFDREPAAVHVPGSPPTSPRNWTPGRSVEGGGYDPERMRSPEGLGAAGPPPGNPAGSVVTFGRYAGWSLGEIARRDPEFLEWLDRMPIGRPYQPEIDALLRASGRRRADPETAARGGLFRR
jgi:curved DNA-binding protein CbpA